MVMNANFRIPLFCFVTLLFWISMYTTVPILSPFTESLGASHIMTGVVVGTYGLSQMLLRIPVGIISDRLHKRKVFIVFGIVLSILSGLGIVFSDEIIWLIFLRALAGAAAATWVDFTILFASYYRNEEATHAIGTLSFFNSLGQMFGILGGGAIAEAFGWESSFLLGAIVGVVGMVLALFIVENRNIAGQRISFQGVKEVASDRILLTVSFLAILFQLITFATVFGFTPLYAHLLGATKLDLGILTFCSTLPIAIGAWYGGGRLARKIGERNVVIAGFVLSGFFTLVIPYTNSLLLLVVTQIIAGFGRGLSTPILMALSIKHMDDSRRATAMGFYQAIYGLGMFAGPYLMGIIGEWISIELGFFMIGMCGCVTAWLSYVMLRKVGAGTTMPDDGKGTRSIMIKK
jgi:MFS family permease